MHRLIWGIVIVVLGLLSLIGAGKNPNGPAGSVIMGLLCLTGGGIMTAFGARFLSRRKTITNFALQMLRSDGKIDAGDLAQRLGFSEVEARKHLADAQRKGIVPFKADIV
jgi:hypothetical protein